MGGHFGNRNLRRVALLVSILIAGCSGVKTYSDGLPRNMRVTSRIDSGSAVKSTVAEFDIHRVNVKCETGYLGRVYLDKPKLDVGLPTDELLYLDFIFASKAFLSTTISAVRYKTLLTVRSGYEYQVKVDYDQGIYNVVIRETRLGASTGRIVEPIPLTSCKPKS